jgi:predicted amidophosphoribosyltransferase
MHQLLALSGPDGFEWVGIGLILAALAAIILGRSAKKGLPSADPDFELCPHCGSPVPLARTEDRCPRCGATVPLPLSHYLGLGTEPRAPTCDECHAVLKDGQTHTHCANCGRLVIVDDLPCECEAEDH